MALGNAQAFFTSLRASQILGTDLSQPEVDGCTTILGALGAHHWGRAWTAYGLATAYHETAHTLQPIHERGGDEYFRRLYDVTGMRPKLARSHDNTQPGDGVRYHGRGYVQLTWKDNYARASQELHQPIQQQPDLALRPDLAAAILALGMEEGWFTTKGLGRYIAKTAATATPGAYTLARYVINGNDRAADIAGYAALFERALQDGAWT
jgi:putative chitinase